MDNSDDYFLNVPNIVIANRNKHLDLNNLVLDSINNLADLIKNEMVSDKDIELLKNFHSIRRKIFLSSFLINSNEYQGAVAALRSLIESIETVLIFMLYPNELHEPLQFIVKGEIGKFEKSQNKLRKTIKDRYESNELISKILIDLQSFKDVFSSSGAHSNYFINKSYSHFDLHKQGDDLHIMDDTGRYDEEHYLILNLYLLKILFQLMNIILYIGKDSMFYPLIKFNLGEKKASSIKNSVRNLKSKYPQFKYNGLFTF